MIQNVDKLSCVTPRGGGGGGVDILFLLFPASVMLGFRSVQGKVFILSLPNLIWVFIGLIAFSEDSSIAN